MRCDEEAPRKAHTDTPSSTEWDASVDAGGYSNWSDLLLCAKLVKLALKKKKD
jgi:hypothetical protein